MRVTDPEGGEGDDGESRAGIDGLGLPISGLGPG